MIASFRASELSQKKFSALKGIGSTSLRRWIAQEAETRLNVKEGKIKVNSQR